MERLEHPAVPVGRRGEYALIGAFLDRAAVDGAALLLRGEPGAGKTVPLDAAADAASAAKAWMLPAAAWAVAGRTGGDKRDHLRLGGTR